MVLRRVRLLASSSLCCDALTIMRGTVHAAQAQLPSPCDYRPIAIESGDAAFIPAAQFQNREGGHEQLG